MPAPSITQQEALLAGLLREVERVVEAARCRILCRHETAVEMGRVEVRELHETVAFLRGCNKRLPDRLRAVAVSAVPGREGY